MEFSKKVSYIISRSTINERPNRANIACTLNISERTLARRLRRENTTFHTLSSIYLKNLAIKHLEEGILSITDISELLGYESRETFEKAFLKWTGSTPTTYKIKTDSLLLDVVR